MYLYNNMLVMYQMTMEKLRSESGDKTESYKKLVS